MECVFSDSCNACGDFTFPGAFAGGIIQQHFHITCVQHSIQCDIIGILPGDLNAFQLTAAVYERLTDKRYLGGDHTAFSIHAKHGGWQTVFKTNFVKKAAGGCQSQESTYPLCVAEKSGCTDSLVPCCLPSSHAPLGNSQEHCIMRGTIVSLPLE